MSNPNVLTYSVTVQHTLQHSALTSAISR